MDPRPPEEVPQVELPSQETLKNIVFSADMLTKDIEADEASGNPEIPFPIDINSGIVVSKKRDANRQLRPDNPIVNLDLWRDVSKVVEDTEYTQYFVYDTEGILSLEKHQTFDTVLDRREILNKDDPALLQRMDEGLEKSRKNLEATDLERKMGLSIVDRAEAEYLEQTLKELVEKKKGKK